MAAIKALQQWCKKQCEGYDNVQITNMTTSWRDGLAFCAILHHFRPDLIDFNSLKKEDVFENNKLAFRVAEEQLGIPALLDAEDMVALRVPDRLSILTYVSQYHNFFTGRSPIGGLAHIKRPASDSSDEPAQKKLTPETKPKHLQSPRTPYSELTPHPAPTCRVSAANKVPTRDTGDTVSKSGTLSSTCAICKKNVLLVQRYLVDGKLYHRNCFRCTQCTNTLMPGAYKSGPMPGTFICINHSASARERNRHGHGSPSRPPGSRPSHQPEPSRGTGPSAAVRSSPEPPRVAGGSVEWTRDAKPCLTSTAMPERASPAGPRQSQGAVHGWQSPLERWKQGPQLPGSKKHADGAVKGPVSTIGPSPDAERERARAILQKNLPFDSNNNRHQGSSCSAERSPGKQPTQYQTTTSIVLAVSNSERGKEAARSSDHGKERDSGQGQQDRDYKWRPVSSHEPPPGTATGRGGAASASEAEPSASPNRALRVPVSRASSMSEATRGGPASAQKASSKGNFYSPQIITKGQEEESPSDWRSRLRPVQKHHSLGPSDVKQIHSSSVNLDIKTPAEFSNALGTPSSLKTTDSSIWTPIGTRGDTRTGGGNAIEVTFSPQTPAKVLISVSPASPNKGQRPEVGPSQLTQQKKVLKPGLQLLAGARDTFQLPSPADKEHRTVSPFGKERSAQQTPGNGHHSTLDRLTEEPPGSQSWVQSKSSIATAREEFFKDIYDTESDKKSKEPAKSLASPQEVRIGEREGGESHDSLMEKTPSNRRISEEEIQSELLRIGTELDILEQKGVDLEPQLRVCEGDDREDELMVEWFKLIHEKQLLMRTESELVYISKQQILEDHQCQIDQELRALMAKAENQKTKSDKAREQELMEELLKTVEDRNNIIDRLDEDRVREMEEDLMIEAMINKIDINKEMEPDPKKKSKSTGFNFMKRFGGKSK